MAIDYQNVLPDPNYQVGNDGSTTGSNGPGFASVSLTSTSPIMKTRTNSGRMVARAIKSHLWGVNISYNPMTRAEFEPVYNFLINRRGSLKPFFVSLPQYRTSQDGSFSGAVKIYAPSAAGDVLVANTQNTVRAGATAIPVDGVTAGNPVPGDLFTITDANDSNHKKLYRVTQVETPSSYSTSATGNDPDAPTGQERIIHCIPGLQKKTFNNADLVFTNPLMRVIATDVQEYALGNDGLYTFSLKLEEALP
jgi:hypothetical protein